MFQSEKNEPAVWHSDINPKTATAQTHRHGVHFQVRIAEAAGQRQKVPQQCLVFTEHTCVKLLPEATATVHLPRHSLFPLEHGCGNCFPKTTSSRRAQAWSFAVISLCKKHLPEAIATAQQPTRNPSQLAHVDCLFDVPDRSCWQ